MAGRRVVLNDSFHLQKNPLNPTACLHQKDKRY
ncbi:hypothetical protein MHA_0492 [Mannheimia haemolytica PHL213]|nr:hypothetical protein MHA_0492 [Mannheimia haemolytica PHL213]